MTMNEWEDAAKQIVDSLKTLGIANKYVHDVLGLTKGIVRSEQQEMRERLDEMPYGGEATGEGMSEEKAPEGLGD